MECICDDRIPYNGVSSEWNIRYCSAGDVIDGVLVRIHAGIRI
jgi:hypothetical protein